MPVLLAADLDEPARIPFARQHVLLAGMRSGALDAQQDVNAAGETRAGVSMFPKAHKIDCACAECVEQERRDQLREDCDHEFGPWRTSWIGWHRQCTKCGQGQAKAHRSTAS